MKSLEDKICSMLPTAATKAGEMLNSSLLKLAAEIDKLKEGKK